MIDNTHKDPGKSFQGYGKCGPNSSEVDILLEILEKICNLELPDVSVITDILAQLEAVCAKLLNAIASIDANFALLFQQIATLVAQLETLCTKIEASNEKLCGKIEAQIVILNGILTCLNEIKQLNEQQLATLNLILAQEQSQTISLDTILNCIKSIKEWGISEVTVTECCFAEDPDNRKRWCADDKRVYPSGNGLATTLMFITVDGIETAMPNPYTQAQALAAMQAAVPGADFQIVDGQICRFDKAGGIQYKTITCRDRLKAIGLSTLVMNSIDPGDPECKTFLDVLGKFDEPIAGYLANMDVNLGALLQKACDGLIDCLNCAVFVIDPTVVVENAIIGVQGSGGSITPLAEPATGPIEFASALTKLGFNATVAGNEVTVCGVSIIYSYQTADNVIVPATDFYSKQGQLVCDPAGTAAIVSALNQINANLVCIKNNTSGLICDDLPPVTCTIDVSSEANSTGFTWFSGPTANQAVTFPTPMDTETTQDLTGILKTDCAALVKCFPKCADAESVRIRVLMEHRQLGAGHSGFILNVAGGQAVGVSTNNTTALTPTGGANQQVGTAVGDPDDQAFVTRYVDYLVPRIALCGDGVALNTGGFQGFDNAGVFNESFNSITFEILGCE